MLYWSRVLGVESFMFGEGLSVLCTVLAQSTINLPCDRALCLCESFLLQLGSVAFRGGSCMHGRLGEFVVMIIRDMIQPSCLAVWRSEMVVVCAW